MKKVIAAAVLVALATFLVNGAIAQNQDLAIKKYPVVATKVDTAKITRAVAFHPPLLKLPNISKMKRALMSVDRRTLSKQLAASERVIAYWNGKGRWVRAPRVEKCWEVPWQRSCTVARASLKLHTVLAQVAQYRLDHELPNINDWRTAVRFVQRIYPGTESWLLSISDREGGWGRWVWYGGRPWSGYHIGNDFLGADTVGGWMQFRYSTFAPYWRATEANLRARGYIVPQFQMPPPGGHPTFRGEPIDPAWLSPLGQALTAGFMRWSHKDGCHWCL